MSPPDVPVLMVIEHDIATTQLIEQILGACAPFGVRYRKIRLADLAERDLDGDAVPFLVRCGDPVLPPWIELLERQKRPYLYYIDDNFWELAAETPLGQYYRHPGVRKALECSVSNAHRVIANSEVLAAYLQRFTTRTQVLPAFFDFSLIDGVVPEPTAEFRIGFAGSISRGIDLQLIRGTIEPILDRIPNAVFEFCGVMPEGVEAGPRIRFFPHTNSYADFIQFQARRNWAVGMAPLRDTPANRAKTDNKYREYGACGIAGVYSDIPPYEGNVRPGVTGLMVGSSGEEWLAAILRLALDVELRTRIGRSAAGHTREKYSVDNVAAVWAACIQDSQRELRRRRAVARGTSNSIQDACGSLEALRLRLRDINAGLAVAYDVTR